MERRRHNRIPVELNAVLIGEKTVPKGCKVNNISEQGLLLKCVADGRVATIQKGNIVNIHLLFQQSGGCKYLTKTADVRHADENSVGVKFHQPDSNLVEFLKPCRIDLNHHLDTTSAGISASDTEGIDLHNATNTDFIDETPGTDKATESRKPDMEMKKDRIVFYAGLAFMTIAAGLALVAYLYTANINTRISALETVTENHTTGLAEMQEWALPASLLEGKFAYLNAQIKALTDSFVKLENRLATGTTQPQLKISAQADRQAAGTGNGGTATSPASTEAATPPSTGDEKAVVDTSQGTTAAGTGNGGTATTPASTEAAIPPGTGDEKTVVDTSRELTAAAAPAAINDAAGGPWVINLLSSKDLVATTRFLKKANALDIPVKQSQARIKGNLYWRLQITGFASRDAATAYSDTVRDKLGLRETWIFKRRE